MNQAGTEQVLVFVKYVTRNSAVQPAQTMTPATSVETAILRKSLVGYAYVKKDFIKLIGAVRPAIHSVPHAQMITMNALHVWIGMN